MKHLLPVLAILLAVNAFGKGIEKIHTDLPVVSKKGVFYQHVYLQSDSNIHCFLSVQIDNELLTDSDRTLLHYELQHKQVRKGISDIKIRYNTADYCANYSDDFFQILRRTGQVPPGNYKTTIVLSDSTHNKIYSQAFYYVVDSELSPANRLRGAVSHQLFRHRSAWVSQGSNSKRLRSSRVLSTRTTKVERIARKQGMTMQRNAVPHCEQLDFYYAGTFAGRYSCSEYSSGLELSKKETDLGNVAHPDRMATNDLENHRSIFSQFSRFGAAKDENRYVKGEFDLGTNLGSQQDPGSAVQPNYYEARGRLNFPVGKFPIEVEGFYTSLDAGRQAKASYVHVHFDVNQLKNELNDFVSSYNKKYSETKGRQVGMLQVYSSAITALSSQKQNLEQQIADEESETSKLSGQDEKDTEAINKKKEQLQSKKDKLAALDNRINRYQALLEQNKNTNYFDSAICYSKTASLGANELSYKQMLQRSSALLPESRTKSALNGLTNLDVGMFSKYSSKYTMDGQMTKGASVGYDFGFAESEVTVGKTEYIGRDGLPEKYTTALGKLNFHLADNHQFSTGLYTYSPDKHVYSKDVFYQSIQLSSPTMTAVTKIGSISYKGLLGKNITIESEAAAPINDSGLRGNLKDISATRMSLSGAIPATNIDAELSYDGVGKDFRNNTLSLLIPGIQQYRAAISNSFLNNRINAGLEYNLVDQPEGVSHISSTKWGFNFRTNFKRYPSVSVSYKPFTTIRSVSDTFNIPQRPMAGSVLTERVTYQLKKRDYTLRCMAMFNRSQSVMDTIAYGNKLYQLTTTIEQKNRSISITGGATETTGITNTTLPASTKFASVMYSTTIRKQLSLTNGFDMATCYFGICRWMINNAIVYRFKKQTITLRVTLRTGANKLQSTDNWSSLMAGSFDILYRFNKKIERSKI